MSKNHPIVAIARPSGAATPMVRDAFAHMFRREKIIPALVEGESFHRYSRSDMKQAMQESLDAGNPHFSHFGPDANLFGDLEELFESYGENGTGKTRHYLHNEADAARYNSPDMKPGEFTEWQDLPSGTDMLFYEGLHGCAISDGVNLARHVDLKIGLVPVINLEWIQKIHRDIGERGYSEDDVVDTILRRMHDYVHYLIPQFANTDINFQMVPVVDTSDPTFARNVPTLDECVVVIRFCDPEGMETDLPLLLDKIKNSKMSRRNSIVVPGGKLGQAIELIMTPIFRRLMDGRG
ncbi:MAG: phosphoribulokinase [Rhodospirillaceae bacterium]|nr:phosphoribulokinase [Rhodospirillaceae bacterium]